MLVFDLVEAKLTIDHEGAGEILLYDLLSCFYLCLKVEGRILDCNFAEFKKMID